MTGSVRDAFFPRMPRSKWILLAGILTCALVARSLRLSEAPGGFLVFNEGWYIDLGVRMARQPAFAWFLHPLDVNNPPLYAVLVSWLYRVGAPHVAGARTISVLSGTWSVFATFLLGRQLYGERTGLISAALLSLMPGVVLVDHNIQVDALFVALLVTAVLLYVVAARTGSRSSALAAGAVLGLSLLTKQAAVVALPALALWETWCARGVAWVRSERVWRFILGFAAVCLPWYLAQVLTRSATPMFGNAARIAADQGSALTFYFWWNMFGRELLWMLFPATAVLVMAGWIRQGVERTPADKLVLVMSLAFLLWYVCFHLHSYYLLPLAPFAALSAARAVDGLCLFPRPVVATLIGLLLVSMTLGTVLMMAGHKWGRWSPMTLEAPDPPPLMVQLFVDPTVSGIFGPTTNLGNPRFVVETQEMRDYEVHVENPEDASLLLSTKITVNQTPLEPREVLEDVRLRPVIFGFAIALTPPDISSAQVFSIAPWSAEKVGPFWNFGLERSVRPSDFYIYDRNSFLRKGPQ